MYLHLIREAKSKGKGGRSGCKPFCTADSACRYAYGFDDIGNRETSSERGTNSVYTANQLNQYVAVDDFVPQFDDDGNQMLVKTATGIWSDAYNGENRPVRWESGNAIVTMSFDRMGRRVTKNDQRFVYDGYLQIADNSGNAYIWDPTEKIATRPLAWRRGASVAYYTHDGNKNVCEIVDVSGDSAAHYDYAPFGAVRSVFGEVANANVWRFSSEYADDDISLVYYNYRHYDTGSGRWLSRDYVDEVFFVENISLDLYGFVDNCPINITDYIGFKPNWPPIEPRPGPKPQRPGAGLIASLAFQAALQFFDEAMVSCDKDCVTAAKCMSCCNGFTAIAMAAATAAYLEGCAECAKFVNPIAIFACIGVVGSMYNDTLDDILEAQDNCLNSCFDNPIR